jgi:uncharacterized protein YdaU (DUF1376 family)
MVNHITQPINWGDLLRDTMHLSPTVFGAYMRLIGHYWAHEGLPENEDLIRRITGLDNGRAWRRCRPILQHFFYDGWKHKRIDDDLAKCNKFRAQQREKGAKRWQQTPVDKSVSEHCSTSRASDQIKSLKSNGAAEPGHMPTLPLKKEYKKIPLEGTARAEKPKPNFNRARQIWEAELARQLGPENYAYAINFLADNQPLCDRCTNAELRKAGSGAMAAMIALNKIAEQRKSA